VFSSTAKAREMLEGVHEMAGKAPFDLGSLVEATKSLKIFGFATKEIIPLLTTIGDAAAAFPAHLKEGMGKLVTAFGRIKSSGLLTMRALKRLSRRASRFRILRSRGRREPLDVPFFRRQSYSVSSNSIPDAKFRLASWASSRAGPDGLPWARCQSFWPFPFNFTWRLNPCHGHCGARVACR
jgi:hypothetical protein